MWQAYLRTEISHIRLVPVVVLTLTIYFLPTIVFGEQSHLETGTEHKTNVARSLYIVKTNNRTHLSHKYR